MGNKLLILAISSVVMFASDNIKAKIDDLISKIQSDNIEQNITLHTEIDPFEHQYVEKGKVYHKSYAKKIKFKLYAIFNDKANINGKWYKIGSTIHNYKLIKISDSYVLLKHKHKILKLNVIPKTKKLFWRNK